MANRVGLLDITRRSERVYIDKDADIYVDVTGLSARGIVSLWERFPVLFKVLQGESPELAELKTVGADALAALIAAATGDPGNPEAERIASDLPLEAQLEICQAMGRVTFPGGVRPFVDKLKEMMEGASHQLIGETSMTSQRPSSPSTDTTIPKSGT